VKEPTFSNDTMTLKGPVVDGSTMEVWCDVWCAEQHAATEDSLFEVDPEPGDVCAFCGKTLAVPSQKGEQA